LQVGSSGALVDKDTGITLRTAPGIVTVNYGLVNATLVRSLHVDGWQGESTKTLPEQQAMMTTALPAMEKQHASLALSKGHIPSLNSSVWQ
jgi:hypothetical protein